MSEAEAVVETDQDGADWVDADGVNDSQLQCEEANNRKRKREDDLGEEMDMDGEKMHILSFGDSDHERSAMLSVTKDRPNCVTKIVKLLIQPTAFTLTKQLELITDSFSSFMSHEGDLDVFLHCDGDAPTIFEQKDGVELFWDETCNAYNAVSAIEVGNTSNIEDDENNCPHTPVEPTDFSGDEGDEEEQHVRIEVEMQALIQTLGHPCPDDKEALPLVAEPVSENRGEGPSESESGSDQEQEDGASACKENADNHRLEDQELIQDTDEIVKGSARDARCMETLSENRNNQ